MKAQTQPLPRNWLARLANEAAPIAIIAGGFIVQLRIQRLTRGLIYTLLVYLSFLMELGLIWVWNRACVLREMGMHRQAIGGKMKVSVELFALARRLSGEKQVTLEVEPGATLRDVVAALSDHFPPLLGELVVPGCYDLREPYFINVDGRRVAESLDEPAREGENLLLMFVTIGG